MDKLLITAALGAALATTACEVEKAPAADAPRSVSIVINSGDKTGGGKTSGQVEVSLPDGIAAKLGLPVGPQNGEKLNVAGVGLYPGARLSAVKVDARTRADAQTARVEFGFSAPGDAAAVADWYQQQFEAKGNKVTRQGETLSGIAADGDRFTLAMAPAGTGASRGLVTITDTN